MSNTRTTNPILKKNWISCFVLVLITVIFFTGRLTISIL